jgi:hypothetical protein
LTRKRMSSTRLSSAAAARRAISERAPAIFRGHLRGRTPPLGDNRTHRQQAQRGATLGHDYDD